MASSRTSASSLRDAYSQQHVASGIGAAAHQELDLEGMPDDIDLLAVLWAHIRCYRLQFHPVEFPGH